MPVAPVIEHLPRTGDPDDVVAGFADYTAQLGIELYPAQEEAVIEVALGNHVIMNTPTGSGKSMVGAAAHFAALAAGKRSVYTAPIKALVSEKFFALSREFVRRFQSVQLPLARLECLTFARQREFVGAC